MVRVHNVARRREEAGPHGRKTRVHPRKFALGRSDEGLQFCRAVLRQRVSRPPQLRVIESVRCRSGATHYVPDSFEIRRGKESYGRSNQQWTSAVRV